MTTHLGSRGEFCWMDLKTGDLPGTAAFFSAVLGWDFAVDEDDWRRATKIAVDGHRIGSVSDLANPVYPPGTPPHIAYYLAVDDVEQRTRAAIAHGARLVLSPFDAGDQGRMATLIDPVGAAFSLWQPYRFAGWRIPVGVPGAPLRMVLPCDEPDRARRFYREVLGTPLACADFVTRCALDQSPPQWGLVVGVVDLDEVAARVHEREGRVDLWADHMGKRIGRLTSPDGLTFAIRSLAL